jgi:hypothetical protein
VVILYRPVSEVKEDAGTLQYYFYFYREREDSHNTNHLVLEAKLSIPQLFFREDSIDTLLVHRAS